MFNVHSDHAFFYERRAGQAIAKMKVVEPKRAQAFRLGMRPSDTSRFHRDTYEDMVEYSITALPAAINERRAATFYTTTQERARMVEVDLRLMQQQAHPLMKDHRTIRGVHHQTARPQG